MELVYGFKFDFFFFFSILKMIGGVCLITMAFVCLINGFNFLDKTNVIKWWIVWKFSKFKVEKEMGNFQKLLSLSFLGILNIGKKLNS